MKRSQPQPQLAGTITPSTQTREGSNTGSSIEQQRQQAQLERKEKYEQQKALACAKQLLQSLYKLQNSLQLNPLPTNKQIDLFESQAEHNQYLTSILELDSELSQYLQNWADLDLDLITPIVSSMLKLSGKDDSSSTSVMEKELMKMAATMTLLQSKIKELITIHVDRDEERRALDRDIIATAKVVNYTLQSILDKLNLSAPETAVEKERPAPTFTEPKSERQENDNTAQNNNLLMLPPELQFDILKRLSLPELLAMRESSKDMRDLAEIYINDITDPKNIIRYLSQANGIDGHRFTAAYQCTSQYRALKEKVLTHQPLTDLETICYALTRDINRLPPNLSRAMAASNLDETTTNHLELIIAASKQLQAISEQWKILDTGERANKQRYFREHIDNLNSMLTANHPQRFVNLLAGADLSRLKLKMLDLSYLNLRNVKLSNSSLSGVNLTGASLIDADLSNANLRDADLTDTNLAGANISRTQLSGVKLYKAKFYRTDFEWSTLLGTQLMPEGELTDLKTFSAHLKKFQQAIKHQTPLSQRALQEQLLYNIAQQVRRSSAMDDVKMAFLDEAIALIIPHDKATCLLPFENECMKLKQAFQPKKSANISVHPSRQEARETIKAIMQKIAWLESASSIQASASSQLTQPAIEIRKEYLRLYDLLEKYRDDLNSREKVSEAWGISPELWHTIYFMCFSILYKPIWIGPSLVDSPPTVQGNERDKCFASEVYNAGIFHIEKLQHIKLEDLEDYLYQEEDFFIREEGKAKAHAKLGDLFITFYPGGHGSFAATVEIIDFANRKRKLAFAFNTKCPSDLDFEGYFPIDPILCYESPSAVRRDSIPAEFLTQMREAIALKKQFIERVFVSERENRARKVEKKSLEVSSHQKQSPGIDSAAVGGKAVKAAPGMQATQLTPSKTEATARSAMLAYSSSQLAKITGLNPQAAPTISYPKRSNRSTSATLPTPSRGSSAYGSKSSMFRPLAPPSQPGNSNRPILATPPAPPSRGSSAGYNSSRLHAPAGTTSPSRSSNQLTAVTPRPIPSRGSSVGHNSHGLYARVPNVALPGQQPATSQANQSSSFRHPSEF
ncbi:Secreted effector protein PipB [Legionella nautarum]|uniref:Secreted effector protein PipB n=1 Tax=Legionella nautarum TaxID=45070 RepID=A0A0W0WWW3_9GAMM|nr:pentapeptide repeat-containing protein [Legionella nautarum]KTD36808.1 Secreted effector protein PipB [Legionella nautarum]